MASRQPAKKATGRKQTRPASSAPVAPSTHEMQAAVEGVDVTDKVTLRGAEFRIAERPGGLAQYKVAFIATNADRFGYQQQYAAMYELLYSCIDESEWPRFERHAIDTRATEQELGQVCFDVIGILAARPPESPSGSSNGRRPTSANSKGSSPKTATRRGQPEMISVDDLLKGR